MKVTKYKNLKCYSGFKLLPKGYRCITLFGSVFFRMNYDDMINYLNTTSGEITMNHENIHVLQNKELYNWWIPFYLLYVYYFLKLYLVTFKWKMSYRTISFELEAYLNSNNINYDKSEWKRYVYSNAYRKSWYEWYFGK